MPTIKLSLLIQCDSIAKDRGWFSTYTPFTSSLETLSVRGSFKVLGIGTVKIPVKATPDSAVTTYLELENVLHVPDIVCNVIGQPIVQGGSVVYFRNEKDSKGHIRDSNQNQLAFFRPDRALFVLAVEEPEGNHFRPAVIVEGTCWLIDCYWEEKEVKRWEEFKKTQSA